MMYDQQFRTDAQGVSDPIALEAPDPWLSYDRWQREMPYATYHVEVRMEGYNTEERQGIQIFADQSSTLYVAMKPSSTKEPGRNIQVIDEHRLFDAGEPYA